MIANGLGTIAPYAALFAVFTTSHCGLPAANHADSTVVEQDVVGFSPEISESGHPDSHDTAIRPAGGTAVVFEPGSPDFFAKPFPADWRLQDGRLDLDDFPNPRAVPLVEATVAAAEEFLVDGFSVVPVVYFRFDGAIDAASLDLPYVPSDPQASIQLIDVTAGEEFGARTPLEWLYRRDDGLYIPRDTLMMRPVWGYVLHEGHTYAAIVTDQVLDRQGRPLAPSGPFLKALHDGDYGLGPLRDYLQGDAWASQHIVAGTVFTVGSPTREARAIREFLLQGAPPPLLDIGPVSGGPGYLAYEGHYLAPNFLSGDPPYAAEGGGFVFDGDTPVVQYMEKMRFILVVPKDQVMPQAGWPVCLYSHGTGGDYKSVLNGPGQELASVGIASIGIDQPLHGARIDLPLSKDLLELYSFNYLNPEAGRSVQRHSIADVVSLVQLVRSGQLTFQNADGSNGWIDPNRILFFGHSQGGLTGGMVFGVEDRLLGGVLSGAGGGISLTVIERQDPDLYSLLKEALWIDDPEELTQFHPAVQLIQWIADVTDPISYAPYYFTSFEPGGRPRNILMTEGLKDPYTPADTAEALATAAGIPLLSPYAHMPNGMFAKGYAPVEPPVLGNAAGGGATAVLAQFPDQGHFLVFSSPSAQWLYRNFMDALAHEGIAKVPEDWVGP